MGVKGNSRGLQSLLGVASGAISKCREMWGLDHRSLALFRVLLGIVCFGDCLLKYGDVEAFYTDNGIISRKTMFESFAAWYDFSFHTMNGSLAFQQFLFAIHFLLSFLFIIGYKTRLVTVLLYLWTRSVQDRLLIVLHSGDDVHRILLFWSIFLPLGACYSIDSCYFGPLSSSSAPKKQKSRFTISTATLALLLQMGLLYFTSVFHKIGADWKRDYTATFYAVNMDYYRTLIGDLFLIGPDWILKALTFGVWWWEAVGPFLLVLPIIKTPWVRTFAAFGFMMLHVGLGACMRLGQFIWICICVEFAFLPFQLWDWIEARLRTKERLGLRIYCNQPYKNVSFSRFFTTTFRTFFLIPETELFDLNSFNGSTTDIESGSGSGKFAPSSQTWLMTETLQGTQSRNADAVVVLFRHSPLLWPFAGLMALSFVKGMVNFTFGHLQRLTTTDANTSFFGIYVLPTEKVKSQSRRLRRVMGRILLNFVGGILLLALLLWNLHTIGWLKASPTLTEGIHIAGIEQSWRMFSPGPPHHHFWHIIQAKLADGSEVELFKDGALWTWKPNEPFSFTHPKDQFITYRSHPWYKFWESYNWNDASDVLRLNFGRWVCREYNKRHGGTPKELKTFNVWINWESVNLDHSRTPGDREILWQHVC